MGELIVAGNEIDIVSTREGEIVSKALQLMLQEWRSPDTVVAYVGDIEKFFVWRGVQPAPAEVRDPYKRLNWLQGPMREAFALGTRDVKFLLSAYKGSMLDAGLSPATINRRLSSLRSLWELARGFELTQVAAAGLVKNVARKRIRPVAGPTPEEARAIFSKVDRSTVEGKRDRAILLILWSNIIRREGISSLNIEHYDAKRRHLHVKMKGYGNDRVTVTVPVRTRNAIDAYLQARTGGQRLDNGSPLFLNASRSRPGRLTGWGVSDVVRRYGAAALDRVVRAHKFRHGGATAYAKKTGDMMGLQALGNWADPATAMRYVDDAADRQANASDILSSLV